MSEPEYLSKALSDPSLTDEQRLFVAMARIRAVLEELAHRKPNPPSQDQLAGAFFGLGYLFATAHGKTHR